MLNERYFTANEKNYTKFWNENKIYKYDFHFLSACNKHVGKILTA